MKKKYIKKYICQDIKRKKRKEMRKAKRCERKDPAHVMRLLGQLCGEVRERDLCRRPLPSGIQASHSDFTVFHSAGPESTYRSHSKYIPRAKISQAYRKNR